MHRENTHRPIIGVAATGVLALFNYRVGDNQLHDQVSTLLIAIAFGFATVVIVALTTNWRWRAVAVMISVGGTALTYWMISGKSFGLIRYDQSVTRAILRASLDFGSVLLIICLAVFVHDRYRGQDARLFDWLDPRTPKDSPHDGHPR